MADFAGKVAAALAATPSTSLRGGQVVRLTSGELAVNLGGVVQPARWADPIIVTEGDAVLVALTSAGVGQSSAIILARLTSSPRPAEGTVTTAPPSSPTITITAGGASYAAKFVASYTPVVGDLVTLLWQASTPYVLGKVGIVAAPVYVPPPAPPPPPPGPAQTGTDTFATTDTGTWDVSRGSWSAYAGTTLIQGTYGGDTSTGAWFYGTGPASLAGRTVTGLRLRVPARRRMGSYNAAAALHLYAHNAATRPGGEPGRTAGPVDFTMPPGYGGGDWVNLPAGWGAQIVAGGGIAIAGNPYAGVSGRSDDPASGQVQIDWAR